MKNLHFSITTASVLVAAALGLFAGSACAETMTTQLGTVNATNAPTRGMNMSQVEKRYGAPNNKLPVAGGDTPRHPPINRWVYPNYTVYFERNTVLTSVAVRNSGADNSSQ